MITNKNLVFGTITSASLDADKIIQLPKLANSDLPTAVAIGSAGANEGGLAYDTTNNAVVVSVGSGWETVSSS